MTDKEIMQMALDALEHGLPIIEDFGGKGNIELQHKAIAVLYEALCARLAQPEPEPVAWADKYDLDREGHDFWVSRQANVRTGVPLYTAPPQREWQGLTAGERLALWSGIECDLECLKQTEFAHAIEAKLKEKNSA